MLKSSSVYLFNSFTHSVLGFSSCLPRPVPRARVFCPAPGHGWVTSSHLMPSSIASSMPSGVSKLYFVLSFAGLVPVVTSLLLFGLGSVSVFFLFLFLLYKKFQTVGKITLFSFNAGITSSNGL